MEKRQDSLKVEEGSTDQPTPQGAVDTVSSTPPSTDTTHTIDTKTLYARKQGHNATVNGASSSCSGSEPVEHDEEGEQRLLKERPSDFCTRSESSGYADSWDSKQDGPVLDQLPHDPDIVMRSFILRSSSRSSISQISESFTWECSKCKMFRETCPSQETIDFWNEVETSGSNRKTNCHSKFWIKFYEKLKEKFPLEEGLNSRQTKYLLKTLLGVDGADDGEVSLSNLLKIVRFFGPVKKDGESGKCCLVEHLHGIVTKSLKKEAHRDSWFAGEMSRAEAEDLLKKQKDGTYLVRMSQSGSDNGDFVVSVKYDKECHHFEIEGNPLESSRSPTLNCHLTFLGRTYRTLPEAIEDLKTTPLQEADDEDDIWCTRVCPSLPFNTVVTPYKRTK